MGTTTTVSGTILGGSGSGSGSGGSATRDDARRSPIGSLSAALTVLRNLSGLPRRAPARRALQGLPPHRAARTIELAADDGDRLRVHVQGAGRPVVLVHGLGGSHRDWDALAALLAPSHAVYRFDARGHGGRRADGGEALTLARLARDLALVIERLQLDGALLVGHSMGALTVMQYLADHGERRVAGVCLVDQSPCIVSDGQWDCALFGRHSRSRHEQLLARLRADFARTVIGELAPALPAPLRERCERDGWLRRLLCGALSRLRVEPLIGLLESLGAADFRALMARLRLPVLVVLGGRSHHYAGVPLARYYGACLQRGAVLTYEACAHSLHRQAPRRLAQDLGAFAARCGA